MVVTEGRGHAWLTDDWTRIEISVEGSTLGAGMNRAWCEADGSPNHP